MSHIVKQLGKGTITATAVGTADVLYTNPTLFDTAVDYIQFFNTHTSDVTVTLCIVNDNAGVAGTPAATDVVYEKVLQTRKGVMIGRQDIMIMLNDTGDTVNAYASVTAVINYVVYGAKMTDQT